MLKAEKKVEGLIESSDTYLSQNNVQKARASLEDAKSTCEKHNLGSVVMSKINRKLGGINRAQEVANYKEKRGSFSVASARRESSVGVSVEKGNPLINTVSERMSKPSTSRSSAHDGSVDNEVFVDDKASFFKQDEHARASDACQESRRRSSIGSPSDASVACNTIDALLKNKGYSVSRNLLNDKVAKMMREMAKSQDQSESQLSQKTDNKPEAYFNDSINDSANEKVTKTSLKHESCLGNTSTGTDLGTSVSRSRHIRGSTITIPSPNTNKDRSISGSSQSSLRNDGLGNPSANMGQPILERVASYRGKKGGKT